LKKGYGHDSPHAHDAAALVATRGSAPAFHLTPLGFIGISVVSGLIVWWITTTLEDRKKASEAQPPTQ